MIIALLLSTVHGLSITSPERLSAESLINIPVHVSGASPGGVVIVEWDNPLLGVYPGQEVLSKAYEQLSFTVITQEGACGQSPIRFECGGEESTTLLDLGECEPLTTSTSNTTLPVEKDFSLFNKQRLETATRFLRVSKELNSMIGEFHELVAEAKKEQDFNKKTSLADRAASLLNKMKILTPYIVLKDEGTARVSGELSAEVEEVLGDVNAAGLPFYKKYYVAEEQSGGTTGDPVVNAFTMFEISVYNPSNESVTVYVAEGGKADDYSVKPFYENDITVWELNMTPKAEFKIKYTINKPSPPIVPTRVYWKPVPEEENTTQPMPEPVVEDKVETRESNSLLDLLKLVEAFLEGLFRTR